MDMPTCNVHGDKMHIAHCLVQNVHYTIHTLPHYLPYNSTKKSFCANKGKKWGSKSILTGLRIHKTKIKVFPEYKIVKLNGRGLIPKMHIKFRDKANPV